MGLDFKNGPFETDLASVVVCAYGFTTMPYSAVHVQYVHCTVQLVTLAHCLSHIFIYLYFSLKNLQEKYFHSWKLFCLDFFSLTDLTQYDDFL